MAHNTYYPEEVLIEKMECGEYGWLDYVNHFSAEWQDELVEYCKAHSLMIDDAAAEQFVHYKNQHKPDETGLATRNACSFDAQRYASPCRTCG